MENTNKKAITNQPLPVMVLHKKTLWQQIVKNKHIYAFLLPAVVITAIFHYGSMLGLSIAFMDYDINLAFDSKFYGFKNFAEFFESPTFWRNLGNTVGINLLNIAISFPMPIILALIISTYKDGKFKKATQTISYLPHFISWVVVAGLVYRMLDVETGIANTLITSFGGEAIPFMREPQYFKLITVLTNVWKDVGWGSIVYLSAIAGIDQEQYEAASADGASGFQKMIHITIPCLMPTIALMFIVNMGKLVANGITLDAIYNMRNPLVSSTSDTIDFYIYEQGIRQAKYGIATAMGLVQGVVNLTLVLCSNKISKWIHGYGAF